MLTLKGCPNEVKTKTIKVNGVSVKMVIDEFDIEAERQEKASQDFNQLRIVKRKKQRKRETMRMARTDIQRMAFTKGKNVKPLL